MVVFPHCKINLGLHILDKRPDGYHNLQTVFYPLPIKDALEIIKHPDYSATANSFSQTGADLGVAPGKNICEKAWAVLKKDFPELPFVQMHLQKAIPTGAGLGGGSSDGAFALALLNEKFALGLSKEQLADYALLLGSDCPFFIHRQPCFASGRGEVLEPISLSLRGYQVIVVHPGIHVSTAWAFAHLPKERQRTDLKKIVQLPVQKWQNQMVNDFEEPISQHHPQITTIKNTLLDGGALYCSMSGSGSSVFGIFAKGEMPHLSFPSHYFVKTVALA